MNSKLKTKAGIFIFSLITQSMNCMSLMLSGIAAEFTSASTTSIQLIFTMITLASVAGTILAGKLACITTKKKSVLMFMMLMVAGGVFGRLFGNSIGMLYIASIIIGLANGVLIPMGSSLIAEYFEGKERASVVGLQSLFVSGGAIILNMLAGMLAAAYWKNTYLVLLAAIPVMILVWILLPEGMIEKAENGEKVPVFNKFLVVMILHALVFGICWMTFYTNNTYYVFELGLGNETQAGYVTMIFSLGSVLMGLVLGKVMHLTGKYCFAAGLMVSALGFCCFAIASNLPMLFIGALLQGAGFGLFMPSGYTLIPNNMHPAAITMGISLFTAAMSLGGFINPYIITTIASAVSETVACRFGTAAVIQTANALICIITTNLIMGKKTEKK